MLVYNGVGIEERRADEVEPGDRLVISTAWPEDAGWDGSIDLIDVAMPRVAIRLQMQLRRGHHLSRDLQLLRQLAARAHILAPAAAGQFLTASAKACHARSPCRPVLSGSRNQV